MNRQEPDNTYHQTEEITRAKENILGQLFESMGEGCSPHQVIYNEAGEPCDYIIIDINPAYETIMGLKKEAVIGKRASEVFGCQEPPYLDIFSRVAASGKPYSFETYFASINKYFNISVFSSKKGYFTTVIADISERKKAEMALQDSERKFRDLVELLPEMVFEIDLKGNLTFVNNAYIAMFGYHDLQKEKINITDYLIPADRQRVLSNIQKFSAGEKVGMSEYEIIRHDGIHAPVLSSSSLIRNNQGTVAGVRGVLIDISDRKKAEDQIKLDEARLESQLRISQYQEESEQDLLNFALEEAIKLTQSKIGYIFYYDEDKKELILNTYSREVYSECSIANPQRVYQLEKTGIWGEAVRQKRAIIVNNFAAPHPLKKGLPAGHASLQKYMTIPVFDKEKIVAVLGVANKETDYDQTDVRQLTLLMASVWRMVTKRRVSEELKATLEKLQHSYDLEKAQRQELEEEAKARGMLLNILGHELRTPLTPLTASSTMLQGNWDTTSDDVKKKLINNIQKSTLSLSERLEELLELARLSRGTFTLKKQPCDLAALIQKVAVGYQVLAAQQEKDLKLELNRDGLGDIEADPGRLEQVLNNLLSNAIKYSLENTVITLKASRVKDEAIIEVQDQGIGISPEQQKDLFQPYHRVEQDRKYPGLGLGLAVSKQIVEAHGGSITIESELGQGAKFIVRLPVKGR